MEPNELSPKCDNVLVKNQLKTFCRQDHSCGKQDNRRTVQELQKLHNWSMNHHSNHRKYLEYNFVWKWMLFQKAWCFAQTFRAQINFSFFFIEQK